MLHGISLPAGLFGSMAYMFLLSGRRGETLNSTGVNYNIYPGYIVNTALKTTQARSVIQCALLCSNLGHVSPECRSATFYSVTDTCVLSNDGEWDIANLGNPSFMTVTLPQPQPAPELDRSPGNKGTEFYIGYIINNFLYPIPQLFFVPTVPTNVTVYIPCLSIHENFLLFEATVRSYNTSLRPFETGQSNAGVFVHSDHAISLFMGSNHTRRLSMSAVPPVVSLGKNYIIQANPNTDTSFTVVSTQDNTQVTIQTGASNNSYSLNRLDTVVVKDPAEGISGHIVSANSTLVVNSGAKCTMIPKGQLACDDVSEILPPEEYYGHVFVVSFMYPRPGFTIGIVAKTQDTGVTITDKNGDVLETFTLTRADVIYREYGNNTTVTLTASEGVQVAQYGHGCSTQSSSIPFGDPSMMVIPPIERFDTMYDILVPVEDMNLIEIFVYDLNLIRFNDVTPTFEHALSVSVPGYGTLRVGYVEVLGGRYHITHVADAQFAVFVYGGHFRGEYAFTAGWRK